MRGPDWSAQRGLALLGLLAGLRGAGVRYLPGTEFARAMTGTPVRRRRARARPWGTVHALAIVIDRPPTAARSLARTLAAIGAPATFLAPHGRRVGPGAGAVVSQELTEFVARLGHELGLLVDIEALATADDGLASALGRLGRGVQVAAIRPAAGDPLDESGYEALLAAGVLPGPVGAPPCWLGATSWLNGQRFSPRFAVADDGDTLRAVSLTPAYAVHTSPSGAIDALTATCLVDSVARGTCVHRLRLSSFPDLGAAAEPLA